MLPFSQAAENNKDVIGQILFKAFSPCKTVLEIASGTGQHAVHISALMPNIIWQTSDLTENHDGMKKRLALEAGENIRMPLVLDVAQNDWPVGKVDGVFAANAVHIMSWMHVEALFAGLGKHLANDGILALYGPYKYNGAFTTESNARFDLWLKDRDTASGIRDFEAVDGLAQNIGLQLLADHKMPANNQLLVWKRK
jgi:SAM-dependent methyltransferase